MKFRKIGTYGTAAIGIMLAAAMSGPTALAQEPDQADATQEIIVTGIRVVGYIVPTPTRLSREALRTGRRNDIHIPGKQPFCVAWSRVANSGQLQLAIH